MNIDKQKITSKYNEYYMKICKMAGYLSDYYLDRAIESDDYSNISSFLIDLFSGNGSFDIGYLSLKYNEFGLNDIIEDMNFNINDWYKIKYEYDKLLSDNKTHIVNMDDDDYIKYMIEKRKNEINE